MKLLLKNTIDYLNPGPDTSIMLNGVFPEIYTDEEKLQQVFQHLLTNGMQFNYKNKCLVGITGWSDKSFFYFDVADNGMGIEKKNFSNIFKKYKTLSRKDRFGNMGAGTGLAEVKELLQSLGGRITVRSNKGIGSLFQVAIPRK